MAPSLARGAAPRETGGRETGRRETGRRETGRRETGETRGPAEMMRSLRALREHVEKSFDNVGERFPEEARKIHYGEVENRNIYGEASADEASELREEGVAFGPLPWPPRHDS